MDGKSGSRKGQKVENVKLSVGSDLGWASNDANVCVLCGKKVGKNSWYVQQSIDGEILAVDYEGEESQGFWEIGSECAKKFDSKVLVKFDDKGGK